MIEPRPPRRRGVRFAAAAGAGLLVLVGVADTSGASVPAGSEPGALVVRDSRAAVRSQALPVGISCQRVRSHSVTYRCLIGRSVEGRPIIAERQGDPASQRVLVVSGQMHGGEWPGPLVVDAIRRLSAPSTAIWTVRTINPDGGRLGRRRNSHGVDLNRNFPARFAKRPDSGPRPLSEPESRAMAAFLTWVRPDLVISLHGFSTSVDTTGGGRRAAFARSFSRLANITPAHPVPCSGPCRGNMTDWYSALRPRKGVAFTVEMPRSSRVTRSCNVPGRPRRATPIRCAAWAAVYMAPRLPA